MHDIKDTLEVTILVGKLLKSKEGLLLKMPLNKKPPLNFVLIRNKLFG